MHYELWDIGAHFFLGRFSSEAEALSFVATVLDEEGDSYADDLELAIGEDGACNLSGARLVERARGLAQRPSTATSCRGAMVTGPSPTRR